MDGFKYNNSVTLCILMNSSIWFDTINLGRFIVHFEESQVKISKLYFLVFLANGADPDEMLHSTAFHLGLHCLPNYLFRGLQYTKGYFDNICPVINEGFFC